MAALGIAGIGCTGVLTLAARFAPCFLNARLERCDHRSVVFREPGECLALVRVCGKPANEEAIISIVSQLLESVQKVFHGAELVRLLNIQMDLSLKIDRKLVFAPAHPYAKSHPPAWMRLKASTTSGSKMNRPEPR